MSCHWSECLVRPGIGCHPSTLTMDVSLSSLLELQALPDTEQEVQARLQELHLELEPLREQKRNIDGRVQRCLANPPDLSLG